MVGSRVMDWYKMLMRDFLKKYPESPKKGGDAFAWAVREDNKEKAQTKIPVNVEDL